MGPEGALLALLGRYGFGAGLLLPIPMFPAVCAGGGGALYPSPLALSLVTKMVFEFTDVIIATAPLFSLHWNQH